MKLHTYQQFDDQTQVCLSRSRDINTYQEVLFQFEEFERLARMISICCF